MESVIFKVHLFLTIYLTGVIWMVQLVHYPLMARVGSEAFAAYERAHTRGMTPVVMVQMLLELATGSYLLWLHLSDAFYLLNAALLLGIWLSTFLLQVPQHNLLVKGWDAGAHRRLVQTNWLRTLTWSTRSILLLWLV